MLAHVTGINVNSIARPVHRGHLRYDYHHQYSNYHGNAKNYGENFTLWDRMFGTASRRASRDT
jgi:sterol desaturase/sphingolipid hydroxylase (fatty acid hydroxylase superfamily)